MNIVIHRYNSICEPDYIDAFKKLGIDVIEDTEEMSRKDISAKERVSTIATMILENHPMFVFSINFFPYIAKVCEKLKCIYLCVSVDCPVAELFDEAIKSPFNRVFLFDYHQYEMVKALNPECIFHMPLGANVEKYDRVLEGEIPDRFKGLDGVSFVGSLYNEKDNFDRIYKGLDERTRGYCDGLLASQLLFPGQQLLEEGITEDVVSAIRRADAGFYIPEDSLIDIEKYSAVNDYLSRHLTVVDRLSILCSLSTVADVDLFTRSDASFLRANAPRVRIHDGVNTALEMPFVFKYSKINLNTTLRSIQTGLPQRIWDVLGCGGFLLTNYQAELSEFFEVGKHLVAYENEAEAVEKAKYYLEHEDERLAIANAGYEYVKSSNTVLHRVVSMIGIITGSN